MARYRDSPIYAVAARWVDVALRRDDSLFTPGRPIWSLANLDELNARYVQNPDLGSGSFEGKLQGQLKDASPDAIQLMAEALYVYYLPAHFNIVGATKRAKLREVLELSATAVTIPQDLDATLDHGVGSGGPGFNLYKWASLSFLLTFARRWKQSAPDVRAAALSDPWAFHDFVAQIPTEGGGIYGRESLLHLVFPDAFERIFSGQEKQRLVAILKKLVDDQSVDVDRKISQIRARLEARFGPFDFYDADGVRALWRRFDDPLNEFVYWASRFHELPSFVPEERTYKLAIVDRLTAARRALEDGGEWLPVLKRAFGPPNNITYWQSHSVFLSWLETDLDRGAKLMRRLWAGDGDPLARAGDFLAHLPTDAVTGMGARTTLVSFLLMGLDPYAYPPYRTAALHAAYKLTRFEPDGEKNEIAMYRAALMFFDRLRERGAERGLHLVDRLDAQSVTWCITNWDPPEAWPEEDREAFDRYRGSSSSDEPEDEVPGAAVLASGETVEPVVDPLVALAEALSIDHGSLAEMRDLLAIKRQLIFYGPPGTGKTFVARRLAAALAGDTARVRLVQFHPSYSYEDFIEGYRPTANGGGFELRPGPLKTIAGEALADPANPYYLVIDEINRGNIAKVFGELYFLLEYRDDAIRLQYSDDAFRLPTNLFVIGTMNTADRSIALLDVALRRRFTFVPFFPDVVPIRGLLGRWLANHRPDMAWVANVVDAANRKLSDRNTAIGPSFFMSSDLNDERLNRIWRYEILPFLEDYFFDAPERVKEFELAKLRGEGGTETGPDPTEAGAQQPLQESGDDDGITDPA